MSLFSRCDWAGLGFDLLLGRVRAGSGEATAYVPIEGKLLLRYAVVGPNLLGLLCILGRINSALRLAACEGDCVVLLALRWAGLWFDLLLKRVRSGGEVTRYEPIEGRLLLRG